MSSREGVRFREVQRGVSKRWVVEFVAGVAILAGLAVILWLSGSVYWVIIGGGGVVSTAYLATRQMLFELTTEVRTDGVYVRFRPYHWRLRKIVPSEYMKSCRIEEWGRWDAWRISGWAGPRRSEGETRYALKGRKGVLIYADGAHVADGSHVVIGSQRAEELAEAIRSLVEVRE